MIEIVAERIVRTYRQGGKVLICGNGGLAAESEHFAAELMGKFGADVYIPCIALTSNSSLVTALANDIGFENVFAHQVVTLGKETDLLIAMTTSQSANVKKAIAAANAKGLGVVVICSERSQFCGGVRLHGADVAEVQNEALRFLHEVALAAKRGICDKS